MRGFQVNGVLDMEREEIDVARSPVGDPMFD